MLRRLIRRVWGRGDGASTTASVPPSALPDAVPSDATVHIANDVIIPGVLAVDVFRHRLMSLQGPVACWTLVSDGLRRVGQKEVCFSVKMESGEGDGDYPRSLHAMYATLHDLATQSRVVDVGGVTILAEGQGLLGRADFTGIAYSVPQCFAGIRRPADSLTALILTAGELEVVRDFGLVRVTALLGDRYRYFPTAPWADRKRSAVISPPDLEASLLPKVKRVRIPDAVVYMRRETGNDVTAPSRPGEKDRLVSAKTGEVVLDVGAAGMTALRDAVASLRADEPVAVITVQDAAADSCLVWRRGADGIHAISADMATGARMAGNHVIFLPEQTRTLVQVAEDGFAVHLTTDAWSALRQALDTDALWCAPDAEHIGFRFRRASAGHEGLPEESFHNPVDGKTYVAPGGWRQYSPASPSNDQSGGPVETLHIRLLTEQDRIPERTTIAALAALIKAIEAAATQQLAASETTFGLLVQLTCTPAGQQLQVATQGDASPDLMKGLLHALGQIKALPVSEGEVSFQVEMRVSPGRPI